MLDSFQCPITRTTMVDPVACADGHVYDRGGIQSWFDRGFVTSPLTNTALPHLGLLPLPAFKNAISEFIDWKKAREEEKNDDQIEKALLRNRNDHLEKEKLVMDKEKEGMAITQRELVKEYRELAALRIQVRQEDLSRKRKLEEAEIAALVREEEALRQHVCFLSERAMEVRASMREMCDNYLNGSQEEPRDGAAFATAGAAVATSDASGKRRVVLRGAMN